jgi:outer membrane immunogenic protein
LGGYQIQYCPDLPKNYPNFLLERAGRNLFFRSKIYSSLIDSAEKLNFKEKIMKNIIQFIVIATLVSITFLGINAQEQTLVTRTDGTTVTEKVEKKKTPKKQASATNDSWTGFYVGGYGGFANNRANPTMTTPNDNIGHFELIEAKNVNNTPNPKLKSNGFNGGVTFGYNYQKGHFFVGGEADFGVNRINKTGSVSNTFVNQGNPAPTFTITHNLKSNWQMTARPRAGIALKKALIYGTAGFALADINYDGLYSDTIIALPRSERGSFKKNKAGLSAGGGIEFKIAQHLSLKGEYLFSKFNRTFNTTNNLTGIDKAGKTVSTPDEFFTRSTDLKSHSLRFGINYRF